MGLQDIVLAASIALSVSCGSSQATSETPEFMDSDTDVSICTIESRNYHGTDIRFCAEDNSGELQERLQLIGLIKRYGQNRLGLVPSRNYLQYISPRQASEQRLFMLFATPEFIIPIEWDSRRIRSNGSNQCREEGPCHLWAFNVDDLQDERRHYDHEGYDTYWRTTTNFGSGADITTDLFNQPLTWWINTIFHEEFHHYRIHHTGQQDWDPWVEESLANAFAQAAALAFIPANEETVEMFNEETTQQIQEQVAQQYDRAAFINNYTDRLNEVYSLDANDNEKRRLREIIFSEAEMLGNRQINNAYLWGTHPYTNMMDLALSIYIQNPDIQEFARILREAPHERAAARAYLIRHGAGEVDWQSERDGNLDLRNFNPELHDPSRYRIE